MSTACPPGGPIKYQEYIPMQDVVGKLMMKSMELMAEIEGFFTLENMSIMLKEN